MLLNATRLHNLLRQGEKKEEKTPSSNPLFVQMNQIHSRYISMTSVGQSYNVLLLLIPKSRQQEP